ncbi:MAG: hypothetical protein NVSMB44_02610 [Ktedonobacteraceae bacterium]
MNAAFLSKAHTNALAELAVLRCAQGSIAASESATAELGKPEQWVRTRAATQALSLTQLNGMPFKCSCERRLIAASESATVELKQADQWRRTEAVTQALSLTCYEAKSRQS